VLQYDGVAPSFCELHCYLPSLLTLRLLLRLSHRGAPARLPFVIVRD